MEVDETVCTNSTVHTNSTIGSIDSFIQQKLHESNDIMEKNWNTCENWQGLMDSDKTSNKCAKKIAKPTSKKRIKP